MGVDGKAAQDAAADSAGGRGASGASSGSYGTISGSGASGYGIIMAAPCNFGGSCAGAVSGSYGIISVSPGPFDANPNVGVDVSSGDDATADGDAGQPPTDAADTDSKYASILVH